MRCAECGHEYPSRFYFATPSLCTSCFEKRTPEDQAVLRAQSPKLESATSSEDSPSPPFKVYSKPGVILAAIFIAWGIYQLVLVQVATPFRNLPAPELAALPWVVAGVALLIRSCRPAMGFGRGLCSWAGGLFLTMSLIPVGIRLAAGVGVDAGTVGAALIFLALGVVLLRRGFRIPEQAGLTAAR